MASSGWIGLLDYFVRLFTRFPSVLMITQLVMSVYAQRRKFFAVRMISAVIVYTIVGNWMVRCQDELKVGGWFSFAWLLIFMLSMLVIWVCFQMQLKQIIFTALSGYVFQNAYYYVRALMDYLFPEGRNLTFFILSFFVLALLEVLFFFVFVRHMHREGDSSQRGVQLLIYSGVVILVVYVLHSWASYVGNMNFTVYVFGILLNTMLLVQQFNMFERSRLLRDNETIERMLKKEKQQQTMTRENIELINRKCHDIKYQIAALRNEKKENIDENLQELERSVAIYEHIAQTGNKTLDVVLTEKKMYCTSHNIKFNYIVDTQNLSVITSSVDLYSLFGNLIDNAIESVQKLEEEKRIIFLGVNSDKGFLRIHTDNWCEEEITFTDGLPDTKKDKCYHGYGVKSVRYIAEKYGGNVVMRLEEKRFCADILIPVQFPTEND